MESKTKKRMIGMKYLSFKLDNEEYCIDIREVKEIMALPEISTLPQTAEFIRGVINLRGQVIPIIDLRVKFHFKHTEDTKTTCVIVIDYTHQDSHMLIGIVVDETQEVIQIADEDISSIPYVNARVRSEYVKGVARYEDTVRIILNITEILDENEFVALEEIDENHKEIGNE